MISVSPLFFSAPFFLHPFFLFLSAGVMVVYLDLTRAQMEYPPILCNRRASFLTGRRIYFDCIVIPGFLGTHLYHLLRMEFVGTFRGPSLAASPGSPSASASGADSNKVAPLVPLSSDAFTFFGRHDAPKHNLEVRQATNVLLSTRIKEVADMILGKVDATTAAQTDGQLPAQELNITSSTELVSLLHSHGINMRFLGKLRSTIFSDQPTNVGSANSEFHKSQRISSLILTEMIARVFKNSIRAKLRSMERMKFECTSEEAENVETLTQLKKAHHEKLILQMKQLIVQEYNYLFGPHRMDPLVSRIRVGPRNNASD